MLGTFVVAIKIRESVIIRMIEKMRIGSRKTRLWIVSRFSKAMGYGYGLSSYTTLVGGETSHNLGLGPTGANQGRLAYLRDQAGSPSPSHDAGKGLQTK